MKQWLNKTHVGDCRPLLAAMSEASVVVNTCVTSPPYFGLRDYGHENQIGLERTPEAYVSQLVAVFAAVRKVMADDGTLWLNLGDSYNAYNGGAGPGSKLSGRQTSARPRLATGYGLQVQSMKPKDLLGMPWRVAFALQEDGWYLRSDIIWHKPNPMPESVTDRPTKSHEYMFLLTKSERYYYDYAAVAEASLRPEGSGNTYPYEVEGERPCANANLGGSLHKIGPRDTRNRRTVWTVPTMPQPEAHFATFPPALIEPCIMAGAAAGGIVLDPFMGSGTTARVALSLGRQFIGCELNPAYAKIQDKIGLQAGFALTSCEKPGA